MISENHTGLLFNQYSQQKCPVVLRAILGKLYCRFHPQLGLKTMGTEQQFHPSCPARASTIVFARRSHLSVQCPQLLLLISHGQMQKPHASLLLGGGEGLLMRFICGMGPVGPC